MIFEVLFQLFVEILFYKFFLTIGKFIYFLSFKNKFLENKSDQFYFLLGLWAFICFGILIYFLSGV